jgi:hypothetical protein
MLFIHPMWDHESQRLGKYHCTPAGYALHVIADCVGLAGLLLVFIAPALLVRNWRCGTFVPNHCWSLAVPFILGLVSELLFQFSWQLALHRGFRYDHQSCEASWDEAGERRKYRYPDETVR